MYSAGDSLRARPMAPSTGRAGLSLSKKIAEISAQAVFLACALLSILVLCVITFFIFIRGVPAILEVGPLEFLLGRKWAPSKGQFGILPMIVSSAVITSVSCVAGACIGKWAAIFLARYCPHKLYRILKPGVELLAGIPSVIYGFFGVVVIVPLIRQHLGGPGKSMLACIVILTVMILPTIINLSENAIRSVPESYYEGAVALGATHSEAVFQTVVPAARSGVHASYILGIGRALGETMAVILVAGNNPSLTLNPLKPVRTLTTGIALEMGYASGTHQAALFGIGVILFLLVFALNMALHRMTGKEAKQS